MEETTRVVLDRLMEHLESEKTDEAKMLGRGLFDQGPAIIHHFYGNEVDIWSFFFEIK